MLTHDHARVRCRMGAVARAGACTTGLRLRRLAYGGYSRVLETPSPYVPRHLYGRVHLRLRLRRLAYGGYSRVLETPSPDVLPRPLSAGAYQLRLSVGGQASNALPFYSHEVGHSDPSQ